MRKQVFTLCLLSVKYFNCTWKLVATNNSLHCLTHNFFNKDVFPHSARFPLCSDITQSWMTTRALSFDCSLWISLVQFFMQHSSNKKETANLFLWPNCHVWSHSSAPPSRGAEPLPPTWLLWQPTRRLRDKTHLHEHLKKLHRFESEKNEEKKMSSYYGNLGCAQSYKISEEEERTEC